MSEYRNNTLPAGTEEIRVWLRERGGIININKPAGLTSHDVVGRVRRLLSIKKVGHTGTLDPMATGVLPVCVGRATRIMEYLDMDRKSYLCTMRLGRTYDTQDITGALTEEAPEDAVNAVTEEAVRAAFAGFAGAVEQFPPMYSARKVDGRKLYEYARTGRVQEVLNKIEARKIYIWDLQIESLSLGKGYESQVTFSVVCSKGTYIRSICQEAGEHLGVGAAMASLERTGSGGFHLSESLTLEALEHMELDEICGSMLPPDRALGVFGEVQMTGPLDIRRITTGMQVWVKHVQVVKEPLYKEEVFPLPMREAFRRTYLAYAMPGHEFLGILTMDEDGENLRAEKIFADGKDVLARIAAREEGDRL